MMNLNKSQIQSFCVAYNIVMVILNLTVLLLFFPKISNTIPGFALGFIFLSPPFSLIRISLRHFLDIGARFLAIFRPKKKGKVFGHFC